MPGSFSDSVGRAIRTYTWLMVDGLLLLFLLASTLAYKDFDESMRLLFRGLVVTFAAYTWISGLHLLIYLRMVDRSKPMPGFASYTLFGLKLVVIWLFIFWAYRNGILTAARPAP